MRLHRLLSTVEKDQILDFHGKSISIRKIARNINRSPTTVARFLKRHKEGKGNVSPRNALKLSPANMTQLVEKAASSSMSASQLRVALNLPISTRRVQQILRSLQADFKAQNGA